MNNSRRNKFIVILILVVLCFIVLPVIFYLVNNIHTSQGTGDKVIIIDNRNSYSSAVRSETFNAIESASYATLVLNISTQPENTYHGVIRDNSFKVADNTVSFIIDVPTTKTSWYIAQTVDNDKQPLSDVLVRCVVKEESIYPILESCVDSSSEPVEKGSVPEKISSIVEQLPLAGPSYYITTTNSKVTEGGTALLVTYYTVNGQQNALNALQSLGFNPAEYEIIYQNGIL